MADETKEEQQDVDEQSQLDEQVDDPSDVEEDVEDDLVDDDETEGDDVVTDADLTDDVPEDDAEKVPAQNEQMDQLIGHMGQLTQIVNGLVQHQQNPPRNAAPPQQQPVDLEDMSMTDVAKHIVGTVSSVFQGKLDKQQQGHQQAITRLGGRFMEIMESVANDPQSMPQVKEALEMLKRSPGIEFQDAMKAVGSKKTGKVNQQLKKQNNSDRRRRQKISKRAGQKRPESVSHKKTTNLSVREATLQAMAELGHDMD